MRTPVIIFKKLKPAGFRLGLPGVEAASNPWKPMCVQALRRAMGRVIRTPALCYIFSARGEALIVLLHSTDPTTYPTKNTRYKIVSLLISHTKLFQVLTCSCTT